MASQIVYTYKDVPTLLRFSKDDSRIRAVMGPFGCLSASTEYLSKTGWKPIGQYSGGEIAQWNQETGQAEFVIPKYIQLPCDELIRFENRFSVSQELSEEHRIVTLGYKNTLREDLAVNIESTVQKNGEGFHGKIITTFGAPDSPGIALDEHELRLMVAIIADGYFPTHALATTRCTITVRKDRKKERIKYLLDRCGFEYTEKIYSQRPTETHFRFYAPFRTKTFDDFWNCNSEQLEFVYDEMFRWDGHDGESNLCWTGNKKRDADFVQYVAACCGHRATIGIEKHQQENWNDTYIVYVSRGNSLTSFRGCKTSRVSTVDGFKYCFTVPSSYFIARCEGRIFITGNSGKSSAMVMEIMSRAQKQVPDGDGIRHTRWMVVRNTYPQLRDSTIKTFLDWVPPKYFGKFNDTYHEYTIDKIFLADGTQVLCDVLFRALDRPDHVRNLLSLELTGAWLNEAREIPKAILDGLDGRIDRWPSKRKGGATWAGIFLDTNPPDVDHWWFKLFETNKPEGHTLFKQPSGRGPEAENLPNLVPGYYTNLAVGKDPEFVKVYVDGQYGFVMDGQVVFPNWNDTLHMATEVLYPTVGLPVVVGFDFGVRNPAAVIGQYHPRGKMMILDEVVAESMGIRQFYTNLVKPLLLTKYRGYEIIATGDPSGAKRSDNDERSCFLELKDLGLPAVPAWSQSIEARINAVDSFLTKLCEGSPSFQLSTSCNMIRKGFNGGYHYRRVQASGDERFYNIPEKNRFSHCMDALQYVCMYLDHSLQVNRQRTLHLSPYTAQVGVSPAAWT